MKKVPIFSWVLVAFFFFGGLAFAVWDETSWIGIGQIWMAVAVLLAVIFLLASGKLKGKFGGKFSSGGASGDTATAGVTPPPQAPGSDTADQLARLDRLHQSGDLSDAEYQSQRERILSQG